jgi:hypothetical protein
MTTKTSIMIAAAAALFATTTAHAYTFHYACRSDDARYALTVNTDRRIVKLIEMGQGHTLTTFRIRRMATVDVCAKSGWVLSGDATSCTATQGVGTLNWHGPELDCDNADTE